MPKILLHSCKSFCCDFLFCDNNFTTTNEIVNKFYHMLQNFYCDFSFFVEFLAKNIVWVKSDALNAPSVAHYRVEQLAWQIEVLLDDYFQLMVWKRVVEAVVAHLDCVGGDFELVYAPILVAAHAALRLDKFVAGVARNHFGVALVAKTPVRGLTELPVNFLAF